MKRYVQRATTIIAIIILILSCQNKESIREETGKKYKLAKISQSAIKQLDDTLFITAYFSTELPPQFVNLRPTIKHLLDEYVKVSKGKINYELFDPENDYRLIAEAHNAGIPPHNVNIIQNGIVEIQQVYSGLVFTYMGKTETIPIVKETRGLEYEITKKINKLTADGIEKVGFYGLTPDVQMDPRMTYFMQQQDKYQHAKEKIREQYELVAIDLDRPIDPQIKVIVFAGVQDSLSLGQMINIDQYIMKGNKIIFFQNRVKADLQTQQATQLNTNIFDLLSHYGINVKENLVQDAISGYVNVQQGWHNTVQVQYPFIIIANELNTDNPIVSNLQNLQFLFVSEIDIENVPQNVTVTPLIYTSNQSGAITGPNYNISLHTYITNRNAINYLTQPRKVIAALYEGHFISKYGDEETTQAQIIVVPDTNFIISQSQQMIEPNINFLLNCIDFMFNNQDMAALRNRDVVFHSKI